ncbi:hypothetical protein ACIBKY_08730 [Nonomuraea sp. NPDC050394]|uniref:hypothetical protein n=1 Tax=Nonomuraea sp. NPDC050394 TaxID=3364363 RepID=UPI003795ECC9
MELKPKGLPDLWRPPIVEYAEAMFPVADGGEARYLLAWGDDRDGERWGYLLWRPQTLDTHDGIRHSGHVRWVHWQDIRPVAGEDYETVPVCDPLLAGHDDPI